MYIYIYIYTLRTLGSPSLQTISGKGGDGGGSGRNFEEKGFWRGVQSRCKRLRCACVSGWNCYVTALLSGWGCHVTDMFKSEANHEKAECIGSTQDPYKSCKCTSLGSSSASKKTRNANHPGSTAGVQNSMFQKNCANQPCRLLRWLT